MEYLWSARLDGKNAASPISYDGATKMIYVGDNVSGGAPRVLGD
jgi:hypothetical protein